MSEKLTPAASAALGAVISFYCLLPLYRAGLPALGVVFVPVIFSLAVLCLFRALASFPLIEDKQRRLLRQVSLLVTAFTAGLALGIGAGAKVSLTGSSGTVSFGMPENRVLGISGVLLDDPRLISGGRAMTTLSLKTAAGQGGVRTSATGEVTVFFPDESADRLREFGRGTEVFTEGNLRRGTGGFAGSYLFTAESLHITKAAPSLERFRTGLRLGLTGHLAPLDWGGLALALILGIRDNLDTGFSSLYRDAGCSYLLALSGMHLAVLIALISFLLKKPLGLRVSAIAGSVIVIAYCFLVGPLPSLNRSALMYFLGVLAVLGMLNKDMFSVLCMAFIIQVIFTPQAGHSLSFILSYLALAGILIIGKAINNVFKGMIPAFILTPISASLGAFIATAAVTVWFFGDMRPVGIVAGLVLAPLVMIFMVGALAWLGLTAIIPALSSVLGKPLSLMYWLLEKTAGAAAYVPGVKANPFWVLLLSLLITAALMAFDYRRNKAEKMIKAFDKSI